MKKTLLIVIFCFVAWLPVVVVHAQGTTATAGEDSLNSFSRKIRTAYEKAAYLSFRVRYLYANEGQPGQYTDSLAGEVEMDKGRSRIVVDGMETVLTDKYAIHVLNDDKVIYLAAPGRAAVQNPVGMLDSAFAHVEGVHYHLQTVNGLDVLELDFPPGQPYTRMDLTVDDKTGYFRRVAYWVNTLGLVSRDMIATPGHPAPYQSKGEIDIVFSDYQQGRFDDGLFREDHFFTKAAGRYQPSDRFKDYHIYLASSNL
jgi:hypothetical protein